MRDRIRAGLLGAVLLLMTLPGYGQVSLLAGVAARMAPADIVAGEFEQAQRVAVLSRPLVSTGRFVFKRGAGIFWEVREPLASSLVLGADGRVLAGGDTGNDSVAGARALGFVARLLNGVLGGDLAVLEDSFRVEGRVEADHWSLQLTPRQGPLRRVIGSIELQGGSVVEQVRLLDANGDSSVVDFKQVVFPASVPEHAAVLNELLSD